MCVSDRQTFYHGVKTQHIIHGWIQNLSGNVTVNSNSFEAGIGLGGGQEIELLQQANHASNIDLGITTSICLCVMATKRVII